MLLDAHCDLLCVENPVTSDTSGDREAARLDFPFQFGQMVNNQSVSKVGVISMFTRILGRVVFEVLSTRIFSFVITGAWVLLFLMLFSWVMLFVVLFAVVHLFVLP
jgi:hypothetical protein